jgi:hypothetical protein
VTGWKRQTQSRFPSKWHFRRIRCHWLKYYCHLQVAPFHPVHPPSELRLDVHPVTAGPAWAPLKSRRLPRPMDDSQPWRGSASPKEPSSSDRQCAWQSLMASSGVGVSPTPLGGLPNLYTSTVATIAAPSEQVLAHSPPLSGDLAKHSQCPYHINMDPLQVIITDIPPPRLRRPATLSSSTSSNGTSPLTFASPRSSTPITVPLTGEGTDDQKLMDPSRGPLRQLVQAGLQESLADLPETEIKAGNMCNPCGAGTGERMLDGALTKAAPPSHPDGNNVSIVNFSPSVGHRDPPELVMAQPPPRTSALAGRGDTYAWTKAPSTSRNCTRFALLEAYAPTPSFAPKPLRWKAATLRQVRVDIGQNRLREMTESACKEAEMTDHALLSDRDFDEITQTIPILRHRIEDLERQHAGGSRRRRRALLCLSHLVERRDMSQAQKVIRCLSSMGETQDELGRDIAVARQQLADMSELSLRQQTTLLSVAALSSKDGYIAFRSGGRASSADRDIVPEPAGVVLRRDRPVYRPSRIASSASPTSTREERSPRFLRDLHLGRPSADQGCMSGLLHCSFSMLPPSSDRNQASTLVKTPALTGRRHTPRSSSVDVLIFPPDAFASSPTAELPTSATASEYPARLRKRHTRYTPEALPAPRCPEQGLVLPTSYFLRGSSRPPSAASSPRLRRPSDAGRLTA